MLAMMRRLRASCLGDGLQLTGVACICCSVASTPSLAGSAGDHAPANRQLDAIRVAQIAITSGRDTNR